MFLRQPYQGAAKKRAEGQCVAPVCQNTRERDQVLDFLAFEEPLAGLGGHRNSAVLQGGFVSPEVRPRWGEQRDVARAAGAQGFGFVVVDFDPSDHALAHFCNRIGLRIAANLGVWFRVEPADVDLQRENAAVAITICVERV